MRIRARLPLPEAHWRAAVLLGALFFADLRCALSGSIVDRGHFETKLTDMRLSAEGGVLKIYHAGSKREIPLKSVSSVEINPAFTVTVDNELYFGADVTLKDGMRIQSLEKDQTMTTRVYVSIQNTIVGKSANERFVIGLQDVFRITVY